MTPAASCALACMAALIAYSPDANADFVLGWKVVVGGAAVALGDVNADGYMDLVSIRESDIALYLNDHGLLSTTPAWIKPRDGTSALALGDIDEDGALDLVCGVNGQSALYLNAGGVFAAAPAWTSSGSHATTSVALGDIDGDGSLDLVCGNSNEGCVLYRNENGMLSPNPAWTSGQANATTSVALGDIDGDGALDLVCGNYGEANTLYLNQGGTYAALPDWSSSAAAETYDISLGDVDGDGMLDIVCADGWGGIAIHANSGGAFADEPIWASDAAPVMCVDLGDANNDGMLDVVYGNQGISNRGLPISVLVLNGGMPVSGWGSDDYRTSGVVFGDVDGDGALDFVAATYAEIVLYENAQQPLFHYENVETILPPSAERVALALGDLEKDGDLDLICGANGRSAAYANDAGVFASIPTWTPQSDHATRSIALGDVDNDGYPDLLCGNYNEPSVLYMNHGGTLHTLPEWTAGRSDPTSSVVLADMNVDGYLDLVCGNYEERTAMYANQAGVLSAQPAWYSEAPYRTTSLAAGDVTGDTYPELLCGVWNDDNALYFNDGGMPGAGPEWVSGSIQLTSSVGMGDINGDGALDAVFGSNGEVCTAYFNVAGMLPAEPSWSSGWFRYTTAVRVVDVDGDGDPDLVSGNENTQPDDIWINDDGVLGYAQSIYTNDDNTTLDIAAGDIDDDGDCDLVRLGWYGVQLSRGLRNPAFKADPESPTNHLPNNSAFLRDATVTRIQDNLYRIRVRAIDVESDPVYLVPEYSANGAPAWHAADIVGYEANVGPLQTAPEGITHEFVWNVAQVPLHARDVALRLRAVSIPRRVSVIQHVSTYHKALGRIDVRRPQIEVADGPISFATVTVGDTVAADLIIMNGGNEPLLVHGVTLPSDEMRIDTPLPLVVSPLQSAVVRIYLEPRSGTAAGGSVGIFSNDPLTPCRSIDIASDIRPIRITSSLLTAAPELPLGEAVTIVVTPFPQVRIERGWVYHRATGAGGGFPDSVALSKYEDTHIATIPGAAVTEAGLEYYIKVENSGVFASDPRNAPDDSVFSRDVASPQTIAAVAQPNSGSDYLEGRDVTVFVSLPLGAEFVRGALHFRAGGETEYRTSPVQPDDPLPSAVIPDSLVGPRGLEYWVEAQTLTATLTDPRGAPGETPHTVRVTVLDLMEQEVYRERAYRMISIPLDFGPGFAGTLEALLSDQAAFGPYDPTQWRSFRYLPASRGYMELSERTRDEFTPVPGRGFWLISASKNRIGTGPIEGMSTVTDSAYALVLEPGWNMIGDPYAFSVAWDSALVDGVKIGEAESVAVEPPVGYEIGTGYRTGVKVLEPFGGYWVKNLSDRSVELRIPAKEAPPDAGDSMACVVSKHDAAADGDWRVAIGVASCGTRDRGAVAGVARDAETCWDPYDGAKPPMAPERGLSVYFPHDAWKKHGDAYAVDIRGAYEELPAAELRLAAASGNPWGHLWRFDVAKSFEEAGVGDEVTLAFSGIEGIPLDASVYFVDKELLKAIDLRTERSYSFHMGRRNPVAEAAARFALIVGSEEYAESGGGRLPTPPERTALHQNYPNPFNPTTILRYDVAQPTSVRLTIHDVTGKLVKVLFEGDRAPGRYEQVWDGRNEDGCLVSTGMYFCRLNTGAGIAQTRKMLILR